MRIGKICPPLKIGEIWVPCNTMFLKEPVCFICFIYVILDFFIISFWQNLGPPPLPKGFTIPSNDF